MTQCPSGGMPHHPDANVSGVARRHTGPEALSRSAARGRAQRARHGHRHGRSTRGASVRAVLHHQGAGPRYRPRARNGVRHRAAERRAHPGGTPAGRGEHLHGLPAPRRRPRAPRTTGATGSTEARAAPGPCWWWRTRRQCGPLAAGCSGRKGYRVLEAATPSSRSPSWAGAPSRSTCCSPTWSCPG